MGSVSFGAVCAQRPVGDGRVLSTTWEHAEAVEAAVGLP